ncbi:MAG: hypothetical protein FWH43_08590 [Endomicrobia bacterium]|nr:hypothetical protein [Endomicrobiia bacterium]
MFNKKLMALFIFISLSINGFTPSAAEVSRYSFVMVAATIAKSAVVEVFKKYDISLTNMAGNFYINLFSSLERTPMNQPKDGGADKKESSRTGNSADDFYVSQSVFHKKNLEYNIDYCYLSNYTISEKLIIGREVKNSIVLCSIIMLFLIFIAAILQRKKLNDTVNKINIYRKAISV